MTHRPISRGLVVIALLLGATLAAWAAPPTVSISSPASNALVTTDSQDITVAVSAAGGAKVAYLELYLDGSLHTAKRLSPAIESGKVALSWAASQFLNGDHAVSVTVHDTAGESALASVNLRLGRPGGPELPLPTIIITSPRDGATVSGNTPVTMEAKGPGGVTYVMLFIDETFTCFTNMPPFSYMWNTTRSQNGAHLLQAKAFDAADREGVSPKITVQVNNPGGRTTMETAPAAPEPAKPAPAAAEPSVTIAQPAAPETAKAGVQAPRALANAQEPVKIAQLPAPRAVAPIAKAPARVAPTSPAATVRSKSPVARSAPAPVAPRQPVMIAKAPLMAESRPAAAPSATARPAPGAQAPVTKTPGPAMPRQPVRIAKAPVMAQERGMAAPVSTARPIVIAKAPTAVSEVTAVEEGPAGVILHTVKPGQELGRVAGVYGVSAETLAHANNLNAGQTLAAGEVLRVPVAQGRLYLDGRRLASDVPTTFVNGIAAGPFRYIVEHSGGTVIWTPADRSIVALGFSKSIVLWIGKAEARVDGRKVDLDLATFVDHGRAIVPLRFFRDALDYAVTYDHTTGRIYIARR